jgi:hypothetical protein
MPKTVHPLNFRPSPVVSCAKRFVVMGPCSYVFLPKKAGLDNHVVWVQSESRAQSLVPQRDQRIDARRPMRRHKARQ